MFFSIKGCYHGATFFPYFLRWWAYKFAQRNNSCFPSLFLPLPSRLRVDELLTSGAHTFHLQLCSRRNFWTVETITNSVYLVMFLPLFLWTDIFHSCTYIFSACCTLRNKNWLDHLKGLHQSNPKLHKHTVWYMKIFFTPVLVPVLFVCIFVLLLCLLHRIGTWRFSTRGAWKMRKQWRGCAIRCGRTGRLPFSSSSAAWFVLSVLPLKLVPSFVSPSFCRLLDLIWFSPC